MNLENASEVLPVGDTQLFQFTRGVAQLLLLLLLLVHQPSDLLVLRV